MAQQEMGCLGPQEVSSRLVAKRWLSAELNLLALNTDGKPRGAS